jgi:nucleoside-diphosphate-sugar epimerase
MARALIVGCGCRGRELAAALVARGDAARGTTRRTDGLEAIEATGAQAVVADPDRLSTLAPQLEGVSVLCWLMGTAVAEPQEIAAIHESRLESMLEAIVDTPVRGLVYEAAGTVQAAWLERGAAIARRAAERHRMPVALVQRDPHEHGPWLEEALAAVDRVLAA